MTAAATTSVAELEKCRRAVRAKPRDAQAHAALGLALQAQGRHKEAIASLRTAATLRPGEAEHHLDLAGALYLTGDLKGAAASYRRAVVLAPHRLAARFDLGQCLHKDGAYEAAADCYRELVKRAPDNLEAYTRLAGSLREMKKFALVAETLRSALPLAPGDHKLLLDLGAALHKSGKLDEALECFLQARALAPDNVVVLQALTGVYFDMGQWEEALRHARAAMAAKPDSPYLHSTMLFILSHCCADAAELTAAHFGYGERWETPFMPWEPHSNPRAPERVLKVGFVSADLYQHAVSTFVEPVFACLKESTELHLCVYYNNKIEDSATRKLRSHIPDWHSIYRMDDAAAAAMIRAHGVDILIDLSAHSANNRLPLFARKPAPLQVSWIGYAGTTGLKAMDYYISDQFHLPPGRYDDQFTEKIARLPLGTPWLPERSAPPVNPLPALANGYITFGSFNRPSKLSREVIAAWSQLLRAVPDAKLLLGGLQHGSDEKILDWFDDEGIDRGRLLLRHRATMGEYLKQHHEVDVTLSPFPYTGATTALHALWMGVPTLTITGATNPTYSTASYLAHLGLSSFIASDVPSFVALGQFLSQNLPALAALRQTMRERFGKSLIGYPGVAAAGMERAFRLMWHRWCDGLPPDHLQVRLSDLGGGDS